MEASMPELPGHYRQVSVIPVFRVSTRCDGSVDSGCSSRVSAGWHHPHFRGTDEMGSKSRFRSDLAFIGRVASSPFPWSRRDGIEGSVLELSGGDDHRHFDDIDLI
jgi:hypothetical protein